MPAERSIVVTGMTVRYGDLVALDVFDFEAPPGRVTSVIGPNGSGKTTFLNALSGAVPYERGRVLIGGVDHTHATARAVHRAGVSRTFQNLDLIEELTVEDNIRLGAESSVRATLIESVLLAPRARRERRERGAATVHAMGLLDIGDIGDVRVSELSYGTRRRVEVARALAGRPDFLLLDEPTAGMGPNESAEFAALVLQLRAELGLTVVVIEHDMTVVRAVADHVYVLSAGRCIADGDPATVLDHDDVRRVYLGDFEVLGA
jgi:branched-chain amino acid transport system ATP-binding protein